jgi:CHAD domain-containing protein
MATETKNKAPRATARQREDRPDKPNQALGEPIVATTQDPPEHHVRAALDKRTRAMLRHEPGTRSGKDPEDLHQMRVSVRRMRAVLQAARPLLDREWADGLRAELGWLGRALGPVRDLDVLLMRLRGEAVLFGEAELSDAERLLASLEAERAQARSVMLDALGSERYTALVDRLAKAVSRPVPARERKREVSLVSLVRKEFDRLSGAVARAGDMPADEVLHELRISGKRLRYTAELAEPALGAPVHELLSKTVAMQDVLGEHQDACVAQQRVTALLAGLPDDTAVAFVAGRLFEREEVRRIETRAAWPQAWADVKEAGTTALSPG